MKHPKRKSKIAPQPTPISSARRWIFRVVAMVLAPPLLIVGLEAALRIAGVGYPMSFFLPRQIDGKACFIENNRFGWRFFGPDMARAPFPLVLPKVKPPQTIRVFVFGESAAYGDPQPEFGLSRLLQALLEGRYPDKHFEVVNTAMTAINSHVILPIARECARHDGDFWVIYMGNNEVVGPYGSGTVFGAQAASLSLVRASVAFKASRLGQAIGDLARHAQNRPVSESEWGGMSMFLRYHVRQDDPRMATVYSSFERNLNDIIDAGLRGGAKVLVSSVVRNLKDCGPFASEHQLGLSADQLSQWTNVYQAALREQRAQHDSDAIAYFQQADKIDGSFAEGHFRWGQSLLALGQDSDAARQFNAACDEDVLRFRADSRINDILRRVGSQRSGEGVQLVDSEAALAARSPHHLTGEEFLYEHVHLNFEGNYLLALTLAEQIGADLNLPIAQAWPSLQACAHRLGWNDDIRREGEMDILSRLNDPPFKEQANNRQQYQRLLQQIEKLQPATLPDALREDAALTKNAVQAAPDDWVLLENLARFQAQTGDAAGAVESLRKVVRLLPQNADAWQSLGVALEMTRDNDEAVAAFQESTRLSPESVTSLDTLAELYAHEGQNEQAVKAFRDVLRRKPYWGPAHLGLGKVLEAQGKKDEAKKEFDEALINRVRSPESFNSLAQFCFARGWYGAAVTNFTDSLRLYPANPTVQFNLGLALDKLGRRAEAKAHYADAIRLQPNLAEAHFCLGLELGQEGDATAAAAEFAEAVRLKPDMIEGRLNLGIALTHQNLLQQALDQFDEVLRRDPENQTALAYAKAIRDKMARP